MRLFCCSDSEKAIKKHLKEVLGAVDRNRPPASLRSHAISSAPLTVASDRSLFKAPPELFTTLTPSQVRFLRIKKAPQRGAWCGRQESNLHVLGTQDP